MLRVLFVRCFPHDHLGYDHLPIHLLHVRQAVLEASLGEGTLTRRQQSVSHRIRTDSLDLQGTLLSL